MFDVAVVGAGPAGSSAALAALRARPDASVLLLDAATFPRDKVCGDGIAPQALDVLADLGVSRDELTAGTAPVPALRLRSPGGVEAAGTFARPAAVVPREWFDARLVAAATDAGAQLERHRVRAIEQHDDHVVLDDRWRARVVIGADGAESVVRRACGARPPKPGTVAVALRGYAPAGAWPADEQLLRMTEAGWPAYAWVFPIGDGRANVGYGELLTGAPPTREHLRRRLTELLPGAEPASVRGHRLPLSTGRPRFASGRILLAGDAASLINPLTGEGIFYAVRSGALAGRAAVGPDPAGTYRGAMSGALGGHLRQSDLVARLAKHSRVVDAAVAAARGRRTFDALTEFGLADGRLGPREIGALARHAIRPR